VPDRPRIDTRPSRLLAAAVVAATLAIALAPTAPAHAASCTTQRTLDPAIPTWSAVNHFTLGAHPATDEQIGAYVEAVARASDRVSDGIAGASFQGRPLHYAVISAPGTPVGAVESRMRRLREGAYSAAQAAAIAARDPALVWIAGSVHSNEPSGADADMRLLYELAARRDCANAKRLSKLIVTLLPVQNPDGRAADTRVNANGFDLNRDWFAATQPEMQAKLRLLDRAPPMLFVDQHEQDGSTFFFPPNADPVNHELPAQALSAIADVYSPALKHAFAAHHYAYESNGTYDLFYPGFGDSATTLLYGAAGMTFEAGSAAPFARRVDEHFTAADTVLDVAAADKTALLRGWADEWLDAQAQGRRGERQPNRVIEPGDHVVHAVPTARVYAYALADGADTRTLLNRLTLDGVRFGALRSALHVTSFTPYGSRTAQATTLAAGTVIVTLDQPLKHWVEALLDEDAYVPLDRFYDISAWSQPLTLGLTGGAIGDPLPAGALGALPAVPAPASGASAYAIDGSSLPGLSVGLRLLAEGVAVRRDPANGSLVVAAGALGAARAATAGSGVAIHALSAPPAGLVTLRPARVAVLADDPSIDQDPTRTAGQSSAWARFVIAQGLDMVADVLTVGQIDAGALTSDGDTALVIPDAPIATPAPDLAQQQAVQSWVRAGGTFIGERARGIGLAMSDGLIATALDNAFTGPGALARIDLVAGDPLAWGLGDHLYVTNVGDPVLPAGTPDAAARYPDAFFVSGDLPGRAHYAGTPAVIDRPLGSGHVVLFAFDAAFRADSDGASRLLANALLLPG
jgi:zinc carboxypeptidase